MLATYALIRDITIDAEREQYARRLAQDQGGKRGKGRKRRRLLSPIPPKSQEELMSGESEDSTSLTAPGLNKTHKDSPMDQKVESGSLTHIRFSEESQDPSCL